MKTIISSIFVALFATNSLAQQTFLALGDSYTIGESVEVEKRYPVQLSTKLRATGISLENPIIIAKTGWRTDQLMEAVENADFQNTFDLVSLLIGVNNQYQGFPLDRYEPHFRELLDSCLYYAGYDTSSVFVVSIPDYAFTPFGQRRLDPGQLRLPD